MSDRHINLNQAEAFAQILLDTGASVKIPPCNHHKISLHFNCTKY
ncbi:MAG: hypothetical protein ACFCU7_18690 [Pleurocapsa sp.]